MKPFTLAVLLPALAVAAGAQTVDNDLINVTQPFAGTTVNPCNFEPIVFEGVCHIVTHTRTSAGGVTQDVHTNCEGEGTGALGNSYIVNVNSTSQSETPVGCATSQRLREISRFISPSSSLNFQMVVNFVVTVDENCQPHVVTDDTDVNCRGRFPSF